MDLIEKVNEDLKLDAGSFLDRVAALIDQHRERPSWDEYFMATALLMASRSSCERLRVGCVLVSSGVQKNRIIAAGYNGFLPGISHVSHVREGHEQATVHAEQNAIADAARRGTSLQGSVAYITHFPCVTCAKLLVASGVASIKYYSDYRNDELVLTLLSESRVALMKLKEGFELK